MSKMGIRSAALAGVTTALMAAAPAGAASFGRSSMGSQPARVGAGGGWRFANDIVGQTSTATIAGGGNPLYIPPRPQYGGVVGLLMDYGADGAFVCSGTLVDSTSVVTAAHCVSDGTRTRPLSTTLFFYGGSVDPVLYAGGPGIDQRQVKCIAVNPDDTGEVIDQNDIAILRLSQAAPDYAPRYGLSSLTDLTGVEHIVAG